MIKGKRILISGGAGSIGSELVRQLAPKNKIFVLDTDETGMFDLVGELKHEGYWVEGRVGDVRDTDTLEDVFSDFKPQVIFHAAALKHVTPGEQTPLEYINTNIIGTYNVIKQAKRWECLEKFVFISTDKAVQSSSIMGSTKRVSEIITRNQGAGFVVVRFGNVLGSRGSVIPLWQNAIDQGKKIKVTDANMTRFMMTIPEAVDLVIQAAELGSGGEIFILPMGKKVNILELAQNILLQAGKNPGENIEFIGMRPGEQMTETLMTLEEEKVATTIGKFIVIK